MADGESHQILASGPMTMTESFESSEKPPTLPYQQPDSWYYFAENRCVVAIYPQVGQSDWSFSVIC